MAGCSLYWHDYESFGVDPRRDRPAQFAGLRTDENLQVMEAPQVLYCRPANDFLPSPEACLITGITPQQARSQGVCEAEFTAVIHEQLSRPGTCGLGYNTLRFDDELTRHALYRNFFDPYEREWRNGNSRWDLIDLTRTAAALRPDGLQWPRDDAGRLSFRLEKLTAANGIAHEGAHDALSDVRASIDLARLLKSRQPRLWEHLWNHRGKAAVEEQLALGSFVPLLHVSEKYPAEQHCLAVVVALSRHPRNASEIVVFDLSVDPEPLLTLSAEEIRQRVFIRVVDLPDGVSRIPLKTVRINRCPVVLPMKVLRGEDAERLAIDMKRCQRHLLQLQQATGLAAKLDQVFAAGEFAETRDPDRMLYSGGFFSDADRRKMTWVREASPQNLADSPPSFQDARLGEMLFRYRARNFPESLNAEEHARWEEYRRQRLTDPDFGASLVQAEFHRQLNALEATSTLSPDQRTILDQLRDYEREIFG